MTTELPPALRPWSASLSFLTVEAALHLGPLVRRLDALVRRHDATSARHGEPDGYGGLSLRGHPERLLLSEWLLADELPLEFLRRAANGEQLHIAPAFRTLQPEGRVAVYCDVGPDQLGAARLVQLAALIVLHRRALTRGSELLVGLSGERPGRWHGGELPEQFTVWRRARERTSPPREELDARTRSVDAAGELWVLAGASLAATFPDRRLLLHASESGWDEAGVTAVDVRFEGRTTTLALPAGRVSLQTLRGEALRRRQPGRSGAAVSALGCPSFSSADRRLLLRGGRPDELVATTVPTNAGGGEARARRHRFSGPVVAASSLGGKRLAALVLTRESLRCELIGKPVARLDKIAVALADLDVEHSGDLVSATTLPPLFHDRGDLLCRLGEHWWRLADDAAPRREDRLVAVGSGRAHDRPQCVRLHGDRLSHDGDGWSVDEQVAPGALRIVAGHERVAWSCGGPWHVRSAGFKPVTIATGEDEMVLGVVDTPGPDRQPALVTRSAAGMLVRLRTEDGVKTLTACSGPALAHALHWLHGLLAVQRDEGTVDVLSIHTGERFARVRAR